MAYLYRKQKSPFWYLVYFDSTGRERHKSTRLSASDPAETAEARQLRAETEVEETKRAVSTIASAIPAVEGRALFGARNEWSWVAGFLASQSKGATLRRYENVWKAIEFWLQHQRIQSPRQITYKIGREYIDWRTSFKKRSGRITSRNTAIYELKFLSRLMSEAVRRGQVDKNPLDKMKLPLDEPVRKPELSDAEIATIRQALPEEPAWMQSAFEISLNTGCRLNETRIQLSDVDLPNNKITFLSPKGGSKRAFSIPMPSALRPLFDRLKAEGETVTLEFPVQPSLAWRYFFRRIKLNHLTFHCLRVTYITRLQRAGVPREAAMRLVNHSSALVHQVYQRERFEDVMQWKDAVKFESAA